jgi:hypothetical protein
MRNLWSTMWMWLFITSIKRLGYKLIVPYTEGVDDEHEVITVIHIAVDEATMKKSMTIFLEDAESLS